MIPRPRVPRIHDVSTRRGCGGATRLHTPSYTAIQASHVSTGTTNNALALNPSGGNVGVGTTAPGATLDVNGTARINANTYLSGEAGLMPLLMNSSGVIKTPVVGSFSFTAGGSGSAQGPTMTSITGNTGIYGIVASGAGSGSYFFAFYNTSSGALSNVFSTSADGFSFMFTITGGRLTWNYGSLPTSTWTVNYRVIPIISY